MTTSRQNIFNPEGATAIGKRAAFAGRININTSRGRNDSDKGKSDKGKSAWAEHPPHRRAQTPAATKPLAGVSPSGGAPDKVVWVSGKGDGVRSRTPKDEDGIALERGARTEGVGRGTLVLPRTADNKVGIPSDEKVMVVVFNPIEG